MDPEPKTSILLVDDNTNNLLALEAMLEELGQNLVRAGSGSEALRRLLVEDFAVILLDVQMPGMDGFETAELIRGRDRSRTTPIIFLTAHERTEEQLIRAYALGAVDFLFKPIVAEVLRSKVSVFVELVKKTEELKRQEELLRENQKREHERELAEQRRQFELERLRQESARDRRIAEELAQADRRKDQFLAMLGHELRNPLAPVRNALEVLRLPDLEPAAAEQALEIAERQLRQLTRLVDDLLDVSRIRTGKIQVQKRPVDLVPIVQGALQAARPVIAARRHELFTEIPPGPLPLDADPARIEQIVTNLLNNAAKYTEPGGRIALHVEPENGHATLTVRDTGIGIAPEHLPRVFDLFTQEERSLDRSQGGLGLGLTLVRSLVELHGGTVGARSEGPGRGSEFVVNLPLLPAAAAVTTAEDLTAPTAAEPAEARAAHLLIVDDNLDGARMLARLARSWGYNVEVAHDGPAALELAARQSPDVVILDIGLPGMDGYEVARRLKQAKERGDLVLIALTGYGQSEDRRRSTEVGIEHHLVKPVAPKVLRELIARSRARAKESQDQALTTP